MERMRDERWITEKPGNVEDPWVFMNQLQASVTSGCLDREENPIYPVFKYYCSCGNSKKLCGNPEYTKDRRSKYFKHQGMKCDRCHSETEVEVIYKPRNFAIRINDNP